MYVQAEEVSLAVAESSKMITACRYAFAVQNLRMWDQRPKVVRPPCDKSTEGKSEVGRKDCDERKL